jgi:hypothetical protein
MSSKSVSKGQKSGIFYLCILILLLSSCGLLQWVNPYAVDLYYYLAFFIALCLGILHVQFAPRFIGVGPSLSLNRGILIIIVILIISALVMAVIFYRIGLPYSFISFEVAFILPFFIWHARRQYLQIPANYYKPWYYPVGEQMPDLDMIDLSEIVVVQFVFSKTMEDKKQTNFTSKAPFNMTLGQLFFIFINDYNERNSQQTISFLDPENRPYGWFFYVEKGWFKNKYYFDPDLSFKENRIIPNQIILATRTTT